MTSKFLLILSAFIFVGCSGVIENDTSVGDNLLTNIPLKYAKRFAIKQSKNYTALELFGSKNSNEITSTFILYTGIKPNCGNNVFYVKTPVKKVASMSSVYTTMLLKLDEAKSISAIDNVEYYNNPYIIKQVALGNIIELSKGPAIEVEKTMALKPDMLLTFGMGDPNKDVDKKLLKAGLPVAISLDHLEETPLARTEWIKFFACFFNKQRAADSIFNDIDKKYNLLKNLIKNDTIKNPIVLTEIKYGDMWYVPSAQSYIANLINDAGGEFFYKEGSQTGSTPLSFETVYSKAKNCDIWLNLYNINSKKELLAYDNRYKLFKAFTNNKLYNNNKVQNKNGYSNYWETGILYPDEVLADLISILHPNMLPKHQFNYYKQIE